MSAEDPDLLILRGNAAIDEGRIEAAIEHYRAALTLRPAHGPTHYNLGNAHLRLGRLQDAERAYAAALQLVPGHPGALNNLGNALRGQSRLAEAAQSYRAAVAVRPDMVGSQTNLGATLIALRRPAEALLPLLEAVRLEPGHAEACNNLGGAMLALDRLDEALAWFERAFALDRDLVQAEFGAAMVLLAQGRFTEGWARYEARWGDPQFVADEAPRDAPLWDGSADPAGRTILLHAEQGLGDTIQFVRYAVPLRARGARIVLDVQRELVELCRPLADAVIPAGDKAPPHDWRCPMMSLPRAFATTLETVPGPIPYLSAVPRRAARGPGCNIGVVFSGAANHPEDDLRSVPANVWWPVLGLQATFHLLQPELRPQDAAVLSVMPGLRRYAFADFAVTAELVAALDVVVSVDSAVAHLAGAMGRPVLLLLQQSADFRWLRERDDSPWYPTMRLFRRGPADDWSAVLRRVASALDAYVQPPSTVKV